MNHEEFRKLLKDADLKQSEFARICGYAGKQIFRYASGEAPVPQVVGALLTVLAFINQLRKGGKK